MNSLNIGLYSNTFKDDIINYSFIPLEEFKFIQNIDDIENNNFNIFVFTIGDDSLNFVDLLLIPDFVENNPDFTFLFYIPTELYLNSLLLENIDNSVKVENIRIRENTIKYLKGLNLNIRISPTFNDLLDDLHSLYRSNKIGKMLCYDSLHILS
jgi:hypothetical protein